MEGEGPPFGARSMAKAAGSHVGVWHRPGAGWAEWKLRFDTGLRKAFSLWEVGLEGR